MRILNVLQIKKLLILALKCDVRVIMIIMNSLGNGQCHPDVIMILAGSPC